MKQQERGVSLVELLVAMTILVIGIVPLMRVMMFSLRTINRARVTSTATNLSRGMGEEIRMKAFAEEFTIDFSGDREHYYPVTETAQTFGTEETGFSAGDARFYTFNDVDDYNNWCRGPECVCSNITPSALCSTSLLETYDGHVYNGNNGYPDYRRYTRKVRVFNLDAIEDESYRRAPYENLSGVTVAINRYNFEETNYHNHTADATGLSPIKIIEVTVSFTATKGIATEEMTLKDVSIAVMPLMAETAD